MKTFKRMVLSLKSHEITGNGCEIFKGCLLFQPFTSSDKWEINSSNGKQKACGWIEIEANACKKNISGFCGEVIIFTVFFKQ